MEAFGSRCNWGWVIGLCTTDDLSWSGESREGSLPMHGLTKVKCKERNRIYSSFYIEEVVIKITAVAFKTVMVLIKGYFQTLLTKQVQSYATIVTLFRVFFPKVTIFGLLNVPFFFCMLIARVLEGSRNICINLYQ